MSGLRARCPNCRTFTAVAIGDGYECHSCGATFSAGLVRVPAAWGSGGEAMVEGGKVIASLPTSIAGRVDTIEVDSVDRISLILRNGRRVVWGSAEDSAQKAQVLAVLLPRPGQVIDITVPGRPTTR